ncbi:hypothetical protein DVH24_030233 [Malus domestica]|uniref:Uncharacterized protein n=1 Tax=Malus domestica TaxID=3750 RepID=A0A498HZW2_MALDO|nr:hypothetical protein DVH24_030233 [Malus domestica]
MSLTAMQAMVSTPFTLSFANYSMNPRTCFWEKVGVKASEAAKRTTFLDLVSSETIKRLNVLSDVEIDVLGAAMAMEKVQDLGAVKSLEIVREVSIFGGLSFRVIG